MAEPKRLPGTGSKFIRKLEAMRDRNALARMKTAEALKSGAKAGKAAADLAKRQSWLLWLVVGFVLLRSR